MSNESALLRSISDQLGDFIDSVKREIEPNEVIIPVSWRPGGRYCKSPQASYSKPLPGHIQEQLEKAHKAPSRLSYSIGGNGWNAHGYGWWDEIYWPAAELLQRINRYIDEMNKS
jgi:hypothetical protein